MKRLITLLLALVPFFVSAQCIKTFPYKENFEKWRNTQTSASCDPTIKGDTANGWIQDPNDNGDWRADTAGTPSIGTGPGATDTTSGNGSGTDYNPGTQNGIYMYTEASSTTGCSGAVINLISPCLDFSATGKYYQLTFAYHMLGGGMGTLYVDVFDNGVWTNVWSLGGNQGEKWKVATVPLGKFHGSNTQLRLRSVMGSSFLSDMAIDDIVVAEYTPPFYDADLIASQRIVNDYIFYTSRQGKAFTLNSTVKNNGAKDITGVKVVATCGNYTDTLVLDTVPAFGTKSGAFAKTIQPTDTSKQRRIYFETFLKETDTITANNKRDIGSGLVDTTLARDPGVNSGALGFTGGTGEIGMMFHLRSKDTLTSITFANINPTAGDFVRVKLYEFGSAPTNLLATTNQLQLVSGANWYTLRFPCEQFLDTGKYFVAVEQINTNNMALGYNSNFYYPGTVFYNGGAGWVDASTSNFFVSMMVRMNFGKQAFPDVQLSASKDTICQGESILVRASGAATYSWIPANLVSNPTSVQNSVTPDTSTTYKVIGTNACKLSKTASFKLNVKKTPTADVIPDTVVCFGQSITLYASGGSSYAWTNGPSNSSFTVSPQVTTSYELIVDSTNGCKLKRNVMVTVDKPAIQTNNDTTICEGQKLKLQAAGLASYKWTGGPATADWEVIPTKSRSYIVSGKNVRGCDAADTVYVTMLAGPVITTTNDTSICFGNKVTIQAGGGVGYQWLGGPPTAQWSFIPFGSEFKYVTVTAGNGCSKMDSVYVGVASFPVITLGNDTTICKGQSVMLTAGTTQPVTYQWSHGPTTQTVTVAPTVKTKYKVTGTNATGCFGADSLEITVDPLAVADFSFTQSGKSVTLTNKSTDYSNLTWYLGDGNTSKTASFLHTYTADGTYKIKLVVTNNCGSDSLEKEVTINTASVADAQSAGIKIYPQPVKEKLMITLPLNLGSNWQVALLDAGGKLLYNEQVNTNNSETVFIDMQNFAQGLYYLQLSSESGQFYHKVLK